MAQTIINDSDSGLVVRANLNNMFAELYGALVLPMKILGIAANTTQLIKANSYIQDLSISAIVGTPIIRIGTTPNGTDIIADTNPGTFTNVVLQQYFASDTTLYITISGGTVNIRISILSDFY